MTLTLAPILASAGINPAEAMVIRHAYVREHGDGSAVIHGDSSDAEILAYTRDQSISSRTFPATPPPVWLVFLPEGGGRARLWSVVRNHGETSRDEIKRTFHLEASELMGDLHNRLVIGWRSPRTWRINATTAAAYPVLEIADAQPVRFPGFGALRLDYPQLQAVLREHRYHVAHGSLIGHRDLSHHRHARRQALRREGRRSREPAPTLDRLRDEQSR